MERSPEPLHSRRMTSMSPSGAPKARKRAPRKHIALQLPKEVQMDPQQIKRLKARVSAARMRQRSQEYLDGLRAQLEHYKRRCEMLETVVAVCTGCANVCTLQEEIELLPASPAINKEAAAEDEAMDDPELLGETECAVIEGMLKLPVIVAEQTV